MKNCTGECLYYKYTSFISIVFLIISIVIILILFCCLICLLVTCCILFGKILPNIVIYPNSEKSKQEKFNRGEELTFCFTDIKCSTWLWNNKSKEMKIAMERYYILMKSLIEEFGGYYVKNTGDGHFICFKTPSSSIHFVMKLQQHLIYQDWPIKLLDVKNITDIVIDRSGSEIFRGLRLKIGLHVGTNYELTEEEESRRFDFFGPNVNKCSRIVQSALGGQVLISNDLFQITKSLFKIKKKKSRRKKKKENPNCNDEICDITSSTDDTDTSNSFRNKKKGSILLNSVAPSLMNICNFGRQVEGKMYQYQHQQNDLYLCEEIRSEILKGFEKYGGIRLYQILPDSLAGRINFFKKEERRKKRKKEIRKSLSSIINISDKTVDSSNIVEFDSRDEDSDEYENPDFKRSLSPIVESYGGNMRKTNRSINKSSMTRKRSLSVIYRRKQDNFFIE